MPKFTPQQAREINLRARATCAAVAVDMERWAREKRQRDGAARFVTKTRTAAAVTGTRALEPPADGKLVMATCEDFFGHVDARIEAQCNAIAEIAGAAHGSLQAALVRRRRLGSGR